MLYKILGLIMLIIAVGYLLSPIDFIPDFIPLVGWIDDIIWVITFGGIGLRLITKN